MGLILIVRVKNVTQSCECGRFAEVWNLVFTQFERKEGGELVPLPNKNIDTGMGLERLAAVVQGKASNFEIDLFEPIFASIEKNIDISKLSFREKRVIADHIRAIVISINDGVIPSNEGRGYVLKKLIIDITDIVLQSGKKEPTVYKLVSSVVEAMKVPFPELIEKADSIESLIKNIEHGYIKVRSERLPEFVSKLSDVTSAEEMGGLIFTYRDTYGLTVPTIATVVVNNKQSLKVSESDIENSWKKFEELMEEQKTKSRASSKMTGDVFSSSNLNLGVDKTDFLGYEKIKGEALVLKLFIDDKDVSGSEKG